MINKGWAPASTSSASTTNYSAWTRPPSLLDHDDYLPAYVLLTEANRSDVKLAGSFRLNPGSIVAMDRGYIDYALFARWRP